MTSYAKLWEEIAGKMCEVGRFLAAVVAKKFTSIKQARGKSRRCTRKEKWQAKKIAQYVRARR